ncbi:Sugar-specific transcriptional regulator TrmB [Methanophagales archaeon]|nr:Sugar-specific transcriptional regulator TrmB [Methanophagales archaeon]
METKRLLKELGLSNYEAEAYLKVVELGVAEAGEICKKTKIPFGRVYQELNSLASKGLIEVQNTRPKKYRARKPRLAFKTLLQQKRANMETQLQKTIEAASQIEENISKEIPTAPKERTFWTTAVGVEEAVEMLRLNFEEAEKEVCIILQHAYPDDECNLKDSGTTVAKEVINASERGVRIRALVNEEFIISKMRDLKEQGIKEKIMDNVEIRVMKRATPSYFEVIDAEKVVLKVNNPKNPAQILAITKIWDVKLAKEIRAIFEEMWKEAKPIELT